jgi:hypothetical protein
MSMVQQVPGSGTGQVLDMGTAGHRRWGDVSARKSAAVGEKEQVPRMGSCGRNR